MRRKASIGLLQRVDLQGLPWGFGGGGVPDPCPGFILCDTFTDVDGVLLQNHTPNKDPIGGGWIPFQVGGAAGTWEIEPGDRCRKISIDGNLTEHGAVIESGVSDMTVEVLIQYSGVPGQDVGLIFRWQDNNNWICFDTNGTLVRILRYTGGGGAVDSSVGHVMGAGTYVFRVEAVGANIDCYIDGVPLISAVNANFQTETHQGIRQYETVADPPYEDYFSNFRVSVD